MQMLQWEKSMCVTMTVTHEYTTPQKQCVISEVYFKHNPRLFERAVVMSVYLLVFFTLCLICVPWDLKIMTVLTKQHIYILMCIDVSIWFPIWLRNTNTCWWFHIEYNRPSYSHNRFIHRRKTTFEKKYLEMHINICRAPSTAFFWCGPLKRAKQWHNDIEEKHRALCIYNERREKERGEKRLHPYSISVTGPE